MNARVPLSPEATPDASGGGEDLFERLRVGERASGAADPPGGGLVIGELLALRGDGTALVAVPGDSVHARPAMSLVDLHGAHIGLKAALMFDGGDPQRPVVIGFLRGQSAWPPLAERPAQIDVDADGQRLVVTAKDQLVLRCGKASITLTKAGKVLIEGSYLLSRSSGVNRVKGGSVQLN